MPQISAPPALPASSLINPPQPGDCVILNAPDSTVGRAALQLARLLKLRTLALLRPPVGAGAAGEGADGKTAAAVEGGAAGGERAEALWRQVAARLSELGATHVLRDEGPIQVGCVCVALVHGQRASASPGGCAGAPALCATLQARRWPQGLQRICQRREHAAGVTWSRPPHALRNAPPAAEAAGAAALLRAPRARPRRCRRRVCRAHGGRAGRCEQSSHQLVLL